MDYIDLLIDNFNSIWKSNTLDQQNTRVLFHERFYCVIRNKNISPFADEVKFTFVITIEKLFLSVITLIPRINHHLHGVFESTDLLRSKISKTLLNQNEDHRKETEISRNHENEMSKLEISTNLLTNSSTNSNVEIKEDDVNEIKPQETVLEPSKGLQTLTISSRSVEEDVREKFKSINIDWTVVVRDMIAELLGRQELKKCSMGDHLWGYFYLNFITDSEYPTSRYSENKVTETENLLIQKIKKEILDEITALKNCPPADKDSYKALKNILYKQLELLGAKRVKSDYTSDQKKIILDTYRVDVNLPNRKKILKNYVRCFEFVCIKMNIDVNVSFHGSIRYFLEHGYELVDTPKNGSIICYGYLGEGWPEGFRPLHFGLWQEGEVVGKWGNAGVYRGGVDKLPSGYGNGYLAFSKKTTDEQGANNAN